MRDSSGELVWLNRCEYGLWAVYTERTSLRIPKHVAVGPAKLNEVNDNINGLGLSLRKILLQARPSKKRGYKTISIRIERLGYFGDLTEISRCVELRSTL